MRHACVRRYNDFLMHMSIVRVQVRADINFYINTKLKFHLSSDLQLFDFKTY